MKISSIPRSLVWGVLLLGAGTAVTIDELNEQAHNQEVAERLDDADARNKELLRENAVRTEAFNAAIARLDAANKNQDTRIAGLDETNTNQDTRIAGLDEANTNQDTKIASLGSELDLVNENLAKGLTRVDTDLATGLIAAALNNQEERGKLAYAISELAKSNALTDETVKTLTASIKALDGRTDVALAYSRVAKYSVDLTISNNGVNPFDKSKKETGTSKGAGILIATKEDGSGGYILTNNHNINGMTKRVTHTETRPDGSSFFQSGPLKLDFQEAEIRFSNGDTVKGKVYEYVDGTGKIVKAVDEKRDLALIEFTGPIPKGMTPATVALNTPEKGTPLIAVGNPHGMNQTLSTGEFSSYARIRKEENHRGLTLEINPTKGNDIFKYVAYNGKITGGNSGGPLAIFETGELVGLNTLGSQHGGYHFAVSAEEIADTVKGWLPDHKESEGLLSFSPVRAQKPLIAPRPIPDNFVIPASLPKDLDIDRFFPDFDMPNLDSLIPRDLKRKRAVPKIEEPKITPIPDKGTGLKIERKRLFPTKVDQSIAKNGLRGTLPGQTHVYRQHG